VRLVSVIGFSILNACGRERDILLSERTYHCTCGHKMDRDLNAAINIGVQGLIKYVTKAYGTDAIAW
jgi:hypothetical protein